MSTKTAATRLKSFSPTSSRCCSESVPWIRYFPSFPESTGPDLTPTECQMWAGFPFGSKPRNTTVTLAGRCLHLNCHTVKKKLCWQYLRCQLWLCPVLLECVADWYAGIQCCHIGQFFTRFSILFWQGCMGENTIELVAVFPQYLTLFENILKSVFPIKRLPIYDTKHCSGKLDVDWPRLCRWLI